MGEELHPDPKNILSHLRVLCGDIGERVGGSAGERRALEYVASQFLRLGLARPRLERFEFDDCSFGEHRGEARVGGRRVKLMTRPCDYSRSTPPGGVEGELVFLGSGRRTDYGGAALRGKIGLFLGSPMPARAAMDCMNSSGLAAAILVDHRCHARWPMSLGFPAMWADRPKLPLVSLPFEQAWRLVSARKPVVVRLVVRARRKTSRSANALAELPGTDPARRGEVIYVSGHVDSVRGSVGASDDASGTVLMLELARLLRGRPLRRTVRFAGYGVEEKLSVGSYEHYRRRRWNGMGAAVFGFNADSVGAVMGVNRISLAGPAALARLVEHLLAKTGYAGEAVEEVCPYSDQFALNMIGVPTVWIWRTSQPQGDWFFHSAHDGLAVVSEEVIAEQARFARALLEQVGNAERLPFAVALPGARRREVAEFAREFHGLELSFGRPGGAR